MTKALELPKEYKHREGRTLPKGIARRFRADGTPCYLWQVWTKARKGKVEFPHMGIVDTVEEAVYRRRLAMYGHHWEHMPEDREEYFGFTYRMTDLRTGQMYLGAKQFYYWDGPVKGYKCTDPMDQDWDESLWRDGEWRQYTSSSKPVNALISDEPWNFKFEVVQLHRNKLKLFHAELTEQIEADVLNAVDEDGNYVYLNEQIMGVEYRPVIPKAKLREARALAEEKVKEYYLRPVLCEDCGNVIPYGERVCPGKPVFGNGGCNERAANG